MSNLQFHYRKLYYKNYQGAQKLTGENLEVVWAMSQIFYFKLGHFVTYPIAQYIQARLSLNLTQV